MIIKAKKKIIYLPDYLKVKDIMELVDHQLLSDVVINNHNSISLDDAALLLDLSNIDYYSPQEIKYQYHNTLAKQPVIALIGHVDAGKTTIINLLTNTTKQESGNITQHIDDNTFQYEGKSYTIIDTPGHRSFQSLRNIAKIAADLNVYVINITDPLKHQLLADVQTNDLVIFTKIDLVNPIELKKELESIGLTGHNDPYNYFLFSKYDTLEPLITKIAEKCPQGKCDISKPGYGLVLESFKDIKKGQGTVTKVLIINGYCEPRLHIYSNNKLGLIKTIDGVAFPGKVINLTGFNDLNSSGNKIYFTDDKTIIKNLSNIAQKPVISDSETSITGNITKDKTLICLKADCLGSLLALKEEINYDPRIDNSKIKIVRESIGQITDSEIKLCLDINAVLVIFNLKNYKAHKNLIYIAHDNMYKIIELLVDHLKSLEEKTTVSSAKVIAVFQRENNLDEYIAGVLVTKGKLEPNNLVNIYRNDKLLIKTRIVSIHHKKNLINKAVVGQQYGIFLENYLPSKNDLITIEDVI